MLGANINPKGMGKNLMTSKDINKVQNEVKKASEKTLTGAVKAW